MADYREPYDSKYCKEVNCSYRSGNKCTEDACIRNGSNKRAIYFSIHGYLPDGDTIDA